MRRCQFASYCGTCAGCERLIRQDERPTREPHRCFSGECEQAQAITRACSIASTLVNRPILNGAGRHRTSRRSPCACGWRPRCTRLFEQVEAEREFEAERRHGGYVGP